MEFDRVRHSHLGAEATNPRSVGSTTILGAVARGMHGTVSIHALRIIRCIVIPGNAQLLAEIVVQVCNGRVGVHFKLKLDVTIIVNKDEGRLDVKGTKVDAFADFYQVGETDTSL